MNTLLVQAIKKAGQLRTRLKLTIFEPVNIFDVCKSLGVNVRFIDVSMEGMYVYREGVLNQEILISSLRPLPRRVYTCAHELGHHVFSHGSKIDGLNIENASNSAYDSEECLVDMFAGAFLMPVAGIDAEFNKRSWTYQDASPIQFYTISSTFGTGYSTLITHCKANGLISDNKAMTLLKQTPGKILRSIVGAEASNSHFKIIDDKVGASVIDLEVGNYLILSNNFEIEGGHLKKINTTEYGVTLVAEHPGIVRAVNLENSTSYFIRIQHARYVGLSENRHLEQKVECL